MSEVIDKTNLFDIRTFAPGDKSFILATWLRGLRYGNDWFLLIDSKAYFDTYHRVLEHLITAPGVTVRVACLKDDPDVILGYSVHKGDRLDWIFVKKAWRNIGIGKKLFPEETKVVTHITSAGQAILKKHPGIVFNPFALN